MTEHFSERPFRQEKRGSTEENIGKIDRGAGIFATLRSYGRTMALLMAGAVGGGAMTYGCSKGQMSDVQRELQQAREELQKRNENAEAFGLFLQMQGIDPKQFMEARKNPHPLDPIIRKQMQDVGENIMHGKKK